MSKAMVATGTNPSVVISRAPIEPPPIPQVKDKWVKRVIEQTVTNLATFPNVSVPAELISGFIDKIQVWGVDTRSLDVTFKQGNFTDLGANDIVARDYSSYAQLPGMTIKVPVGHATAVSGATNFSLLTVNTPLPTTLVVHYHAWIPY